MVKDTKGQVESILSELGRKIDHLIVETKGASEDVRKDFEVKINELKKKKEKIEEDFHSYKDKNEDKWKGARDHLNAAAIEMRKALEAIFANKKD